LIVGIQVPDVLGRGRYARSAADLRMTEAETVRSTFRVYLELKSFSSLVAELDPRGTP
jgi:hypothetical protein